MTPDETRSKCERIWRDCRLRFPSNITGWGDGGESIRCFPGRAIRWQSPADKIEAAWNRRFPFPKYYRDEPIRPPKEFVDIVKGKPDGKRRIELWGKLDPEDVGTYPLIPQWRENARRERVQSYIEKRNQRQFTAENTARLAEVRASMDRRAKVDAYLHRRLARGYNLPAVAITKAVDAARVGASIAMLKSRPGRRHRTVARFTYCRADFALICNWPKTKFWLQAEGLTAVTASRKRAAEWAQRFPLHSFIDESLAPAAAAAPDVVPDTNLFVLVGTPLMVGDPRIVPLAKFLAGKPVNVRAALAAKFAPPSPETHLGDPRRLAEWICRHVAVSNP